MLSPLFGAIATLLFAQQPTGGEFLPTWTLELESVGLELIATEDLNQDGINDWFHWDPYHYSSGTGRQRFIQAVSGKDGDLLWEYTGSKIEGNSAHHGFFQADLDGDGSIEILLPMPQTQKGTYIGEGQLVALNGHDGSLLWEKFAPVNEEEFAEAISVDDLNGNGKLEIVISSRNIVATTPDRVICFSNDGTQLWEHIIQMNSEDLQSVDLDGDGIKEILMLDGEKSDGFKGHVGQMAVIDGVSGQLRWHHLGENANEQIGLHYEIEDLNADGIQDILTYGPLAKRNGLYQAGTIASFSGIDGTELWRYSGDHKEGALSRHRQRLDVNADGVLDVVLGNPKSHQGDGGVIAIDPTTGQSIWEAAGPMGAKFGLGQKITVADFFGNGTKAILAEAKEDWGENVNSYFHGLALLESTTGATLWTSNFPFRAKGNPSYLTEDLDGDGDLEIVLFELKSRGGQPGQEGNQAGLVVVFDTNGALLWSQTGVHGEAQFGNQVFAADANGDGVQELLISSVHSDSTTTLFQGALESRDGLTGDQRWKHNGEYSYQGLGANLFLNDLNEDGIPEAISNYASGAGWTGERTGELRVWNINDGSIRLRMEGSDRYNRAGVDIQVGEDLDNDGWKEIFTLGDGKMTCFAGHGNYHPFITASSNSISASTGGNISLDLNFTSLAKWFEYRVVGSLHGGGLNYEFGIPIPLTFDHWLYATMQNNMPQNHFHHSFGLLDTEGRGQCTIQFGANEIPVAMIGRTATFSCLARQPWDSWQYCSVPISITVLP